MNCNNIVQRCTVRQLCVLVWVEGSDVGVAVGRGASKLMGGGARGRVRNVRHLKQKPEIGIAIYAHRVLHIFCSAQLSSVQLSSFHFAKDSV